MVTETLEFEDIQGYVIRGYKHMMYSRYVLLQVTEPTGAKAFVSTISDHLTHAVHHPTETCLNIAFTAPGLSALGMSAANVQSFLREFREGMTTPHRQRLLGDYDSSAAEHWRWGGTNNSPVHILLMIFGKDQTTALHFYDTLKEQYEASGLTEIIQLDGQTLPYNKEHFGFRDGISQPVITGSGKKGPATDFVNPGEFILGYANEYNVLPDTPLLNEEQGNMNLLPADASGSGKKDVGRNGSYFVLRQLAQDVDTFWNFMNEKTKNEDESINVEQSIWLASKMIGRWPSGAPVAKFPDADPHTVAESEDNDFTYYDIDKEGLKCPFGSHLRRCNPRDAFEDNTPKESLDLSRRHRIMRRGRFYGEPFEGSPLHHTPEAEVGLLFGCFNADISRQYEFVQYTWANYPRVKELYNDPDPIIGVREIPDHNGEQNFTLQDEPVSHCINGLKKFVYTKGGAYFFFPSVTAVRYLGSL